MLSLFILAFAPEVIKILTPEDFHSALPAVYPLEIAVVPMFISGVLSAGEMYFEKSGISAVPTVIAATVGALLCVAILPKTDYRFAGIFALLSYVILAILNSLIFKKLSGESPIKVRSTLKIFLLTLGYALILFLFRDVVASRIILMLPLAPTLFILARQIFKEIKE